MYGTSDSRWLPWPPGAGSGDARFLGRRFGSARVDLDVDFAARPRATVATALLTCCLADTQGRAYPPDILWAWSVAARLQGLLAISEASAGPVTMAVATCNQAGCGERIELELTLADFALQSADDLPWTTPDQRQANLRLPSGADQLAWYQHQQERHEVDDAWLARRLITRLDTAPPAPEWKLPAAWLKPLGEVLETSDPLTALTVSATCPVCDAELQIEVDLEYLLLEDLRRQQRALLDDIHQIAGSYHWSEADIVAMPQWRRARYLSRIQDYR